MAWLSSVRERCRSARVSDDIEREMDFHLAERTDDLVAAGDVRVDGAARSAPPLRQPRGSAASARATPTC